MRRSNTAANGHNKFEQWAPMRRTTYLQSKASCWWYLSQGFLISRRHRRRVGSPAEGERSSPSIHGFGADAGGCRPAHGLRPPAPQSREIAHRLMAELPPPPAIQAPDHDWAGQRPRSSSPAEGLSRSRRPHRCRNRRVSASRLSSPDIPVACCHPPIAPRGHPFQHIIGGAGAFLIETNGALIPSSSLSFSGFYSADFRSVVGAYLAATALRNRSAGHGRSATPFIWHRWRRWCLYRRRGLPQSAAIARI